MRKAAIFEHQEGFDTVCRVKPRADVAEWLGKRGLDTGNWSAAKQKLSDHEVQIIVMEQTRNNLVRDERLFRVLCAAILHIYDSQPRKGENISLTKEDLAKVLLVYYCGLPREGYSTGWLKSDANHKLPDWWRSGNDLGSSVREVILLCWDSFVTWYNARQLISTWSEVDEIFMEGKKESHTWYTTGSNDEIIKKQVQKVARRWQ